MTETMTGDVAVRQVWASDRRKATMATRLLVSCLGIEAEPGFDLTEPEDKNLATRKPKALGECLFKDAFCESMDQESWHLQVLVVDEKGNVLAQSKGMRALGHGLDLLERLPLRVSPHAEGWLRDALGERRPGQGPYPLEGAGSSWLVPVKKYVSTEHRGLHTRRDAGAGAARDRRGDHGGRPSRRGRASKTSGSRGRGDAR